jgi:hypothetical protein
MWEIIDNSKKIEYNFYFVDSWINTDAVHFWPRVVWSENNKSITWTYRNYKSSKINFTFHFRSISPTPTGNRRDSKDWCRQKRLVRDCRRMQISVVCSWMMMMITISELKMTDYVDKYIDKFLRLFYSKALSMVVPCWYITRIQK